ncbi:MAG: Long-chain-fatty-acid--CoA ligase [Legionellaceae bacterium]
MEKIWLKHYQPSVPEVINPDSYESLLDIFAESCNQYADKPALANLGQQITYREWETLSKHFATFLQQSLGLAKGTRIAIMLPNTLQYPIALFGAFLAGLTIVNVNPLYTIPEIEYQLNDSGVEVILVLANFAHVLEKALPKTQVKHVVVTELGDLFSFPKKQFVNFFVKYIKKMVPDWHIPHAIKFTDAMLKGKQQILKPIKLTREDIAFLQYTGGTTGIAKGAILTHRNMIANLLQAEVWVSPVCKKGEEIIITALPLYHIFSLTANLLTFTRFGALNVLITNPRDIPHFINELKKFSFTAITGVNTLFNALLNHPEFSKLDFSHLKVCLGGGMAVQQVVAERWKTITGTPLIEAYGLTETSPAACINPFDIPKYNGTVGLPISSTEVSIRDEKNQELGCNEAGELCIKGPQVMKGYWNNPSETKNVFTEDGWLKTGDIAIIDDQGFVHIVDRKKDMIIVSGFNVYPNQVEAVIASYPGVNEVAVVGIPDGSSGEIVKAFIVKKDPLLTVEAITHFCRENLTAYKIPKIIEFRDELPKTNVGKILRRALKE